MAHHRRPRGAGVLVAAAARTHLSRQRLRGPGSILGRGTTVVLSSDGPFTVFAPTNAAFEALPAGALDAVLADADLLTAVLTYHVVAGDVRAADVVSLSLAATVQGEYLAISTTDGVQVDQANVVATDVVASNGVIHVIDAVLLPKAVLAALTGQTLPSGYVYYDLAAVAGSGVAGSVLIVDMGHGTSQVQVNLEGTPAGGDHPIHFHTGRCGSAGGVVIPLDDVGGDSGWSSTAVDVPFTWIVGSAHTLMVHLAPDQMSTIVACGDIGSD
ncbi:MAG: fasciclin domain-containing protein [Trueperaceae bacterium]|nr:fasciclin domain-containing protein [Trueperaceae bacterium]